MGRPALCYYVDLPNPNAVGDDDTWVHMTTFMSKRRAEEWLEETYGIRKEDAGVFITEGDCS